MEAAARLCVLSDTHGRLPREAVGFCEGADAILHAGDVGSDAVLAELEGVAPLVCVSGNVDAPDLAPARARTGAAGWRVLVQHIVWRRGRLPRRRARCSRRRGRIWWSSAIPTSRFAKRSGRRFSSTPAAAAPGASTCPARSARRFWTPPGGGSAFSTSTGCAARRLWSRRASGLPPPSVEKRRDFARCFRPEIWLHFPGCEALNPMRPEDCR